MMMRVLVAGGVLLSASWAFACSLPVLPVPEQLLPIMRKTTPLSAEEAALKAEFEADMKEKEALMSRVSAGCSEEANTCTPACNALSGFSYPYKEGNARYALPKAERDAALQRIDVINGKWK